MSKIILFPACAGVIPTFPVSRTKPVPFPRLRGGDPMGSHTPSSSLFFSPPVRGDPPYYAVNIWQRVFSPPMRG